MVIYKCSREDEPGITRIGRKRVSPDFKAQTVTTGSQCLLHVLHGFGTFAGSNFPVGKKENTKT